MTHDNSPKLLGAIFDLDGVVVDTARFHCLAWRETAASLGITFTEKDNERLKGVSRMRSLEIILELGGISLGKSKKQELSEAKNRRYVEMLSGLSQRDILPGALELIEWLRSRGIGIALGSASKNAPYILERLRIQGMFDAVVDGNSVARAKPAPDVFLTAAGLLGLPPCRCGVLEDSSAGIAAAKAAHMYPIGIGSSETLGAARVVLGSLAEWQNILDLF